MRSIKLWITSLKTTCSALRIRQTMCVRTLRLGQWRCIPILQLRTWVTIWAVKLTISSTRMTLRQVICLSSAPTATLSLHQPTNCRASMLNLLIASALRIAWVRYLSALRCVCALMKLLMSNGQIVSNKASSLGKCQLPLSECLKQ